MLDRGPEQLESLIEWSDLLAGVSPGLQLVVQAPEPVTGIMEGLNAAQ